MRTDDYKLVVDDTGYTHTYIGPDGQEHETSPSKSGVSFSSVSNLAEVEPSHYKYFVGILIPTSKLKKVTFAVLEAGKKFRQKLNDPSIAKEIHASELYKNEDGADRIAFVEYLQDIGNIVTKYNLTIFVSPKDTTIRLRDGSMQGMLKNCMNITTNSPFVPMRSVSTTLSHKANRRATVYYQKLTFMELRNLAKTYLSDGGCVSTIMCDEGLGKRGTQVKIDDNTNIMFLSSDENPLIQFADNVAWWHNRVKIVAPDRTKRKQCTPLDSDIMLAKMYKSIQGHIIQGEARQEVFKDYIYSKYYFNYGQGRKYTLPHVRIDKSKYPLMLPDDLER